MQKLQIILGTRNRKKADELMKYLRGLPVELLPFPKGLEPAQEEGKSFRENAISKAVHLAKTTGKPAIGEDSGLEVDALGGAPGIFSARYAGEEATDEENNAKLLRELQGVPPARRTAAYRCFIVLADAEGPLVEAEGSVEGLIADVPRGMYGFGYDPLFIYPPERGTFGELGPRVKDEVSHRARALRHFRKKLLVFLRIRGDKV